jgi:hypothetical protein
MNRSRAYMKKAEFVARQAWLDFEDAVGTALEVISPAMTKLRKWTKHFIKALKTKAQQIESSSQLNLFDIEGATP